MNAPAIDLGPGASEDLRWVVDVLWGDLPGVRVMRGDPPPGATVLADLTVLPDARRPRLLVPRAAPAGRAAIAAGALTRGRRARVVRAVTALALRGPLARVAFRDRLVVVAETDAPRTIGDLLAETLGQPVLMAVNVRPPSPSRKPVIQVLDLSGTTLAYAKVGWHAVSDANVRSEAVFLRALATAQLDVSAPVPLAELDRAGHAVLVTAPMPSMLRRARRGFELPDPRVTEQVAGLFGTSIEPWSRSPARTRLRERTDAVAPADTPGPWTDVRDALVAMLDAADRRADAPVRTGSWHGDWSPWNLGAVRDRLWAWDWEYAATDVVAGLDLLHFGFQVAFVAEGRGLAASFAHGRRIGDPALGTLGLDGEARALVHAAHVAEVTLRYLASERAGVPAPPRFLAEVAPVLQAAADRLR